MVGLVAGGPSGRVRDFFVVGDVAGFAGLDHLALDAAEMAQAGIEPGRIQARGYGETELAVPTPDNTDEARNRRVVVRLARN